MRLKDWTIQLEVYNEQSKTRRWVSVRVPGGTKPVAEFETFGALRRYAKSHLLGAPYNKARAYNRATYEYRDL